MKQQETTVLLGHSAVEMQEFWTEPIITWIAVVLPTGKDCSVIHHHWYLPETLRYITYNRGYVVLFYSWPSCGIKLMIYIDNQVHFVNILRPTLGREIA